MLKDNFGRAVEPGDFFIRLDQNNEGRMYRCEGYAPDGRIMVQEFNHVFKGYHRTQVIGIFMRPQTIKFPTSCIWYPESLMEFQQ